MKKLFLMGIGLMLVGCGTLNNPALQSADPTERGLGWIASAIIIHAIATVIK